MIRGNSIGTTLLVVMMSGIQMDLAFPDQSAAAICTSDSSCGPGWIGISGWSSASSNMVATMRAWDLSFGLCAVEDWVISNSGPLLSGLHMSCYSVLAERIALKGFSCLYGPNRARVLNVTFRQYTYLLEHLPWENWTQGLRNGLIGWSLVKTATPFISQFTIGLRDRNSLHWPLETCY